MMRLRGTSLSYWGHYITDCFQAPRKKIVNNITVATAKDVSNVEMVGFSVD
ncbi:MAG: hypothetical protein H0V70_16960 [Ktedonobacteraceae bacterium]|nr:hypothetical protein [Ktedonobacteraceae bacterium]